MSKIEKKGRTVVPAQIRTMLGLQPGSALEWTVTDSTVSVTKLERVKTRPAGSFLRGLKELGAMPVAERSQEKVATPAIDE